jgi:hypothetical protein
MPSVVVDDDLVLRVGRHRAPLSPGQAFNLAERLIRRATRAIVIEEVADSGEILGALRDRDATGGEA